MELERVFPGCSNFVLLGEAGCGKSEIAVNLACRLAAQGGGPVHLFDLDMTKPLFRARDLRGQLEAMGVVLHFAQQFMDAPTAAGGTARLLRDPDCRVVLDVGGDAVGAREVGAYAPLLSRADTRVCYVLNSYRAWSADAQHMDLVLRETLAACRIPPRCVHLVGNANLGPRTSAEEVLCGVRALENAVAGGAPIDFHCVREELYDAVRAGMPGELFALHLYLTYPWEEGAASIRQAALCGA